MQAPAKDQVICAFIRRVRA